MSNRTDLQTELDLAKAGIAALHAEKRALLEWLDATAVSWELAEGREEHVTGVAWRAAHDGVLDGDHLGGMTSSELEALKACEPPATLCCNHCGGDALSSADGTFVDDTSGPCMTCSFPGHVVVDIDDADENGGYAAYWSTSEEPDARCKDDECQECCERCKSTTGGVCSRHSGPEPQEY